MSQTQPPSFMPVPLPEGESQRLRALAELEMLDTPSESVFNDLTWLASQLCEVPIAIVSLIDERRQWFKASCGLDALETPRELAFCAYALLSPHLMEVPDALLDPRFANNALVLGPPHIRFYAGMPLMGSGGYIYGALCVIDTKPRQLSERQREGLARLAKQVTAQLETRRDGRIAQTQAQTLSLLLETMPDAVVSCTAEGTLGQFNHVARQWHSADPRALPPSQWPEYFNLLDANGERLLEMEQVPLVRAWRGESIRDVEIVIAAKGQQHRSVLCNAERLYAADGHILGAVCVMRDVTAEREATRAALLAGQRFSGAFSAAAHGMALVSLQGRWLEVNDALCAMLGYSREQLRDMDFKRITHPEDITRDTELLAELVAGERNDYHLDKRYLCRDGSTLWAHLAVSLVRDEHQRPVHFVSQIQDVTERQLAEQRLRHSESQLRTIADNAPALIAYVDRDRCFQFVNKPYADWFALLPTQIVGRHLQEVLDAAQFELLAPHVSLALDGQPAQFDAELNDAAGEARIMHFSLVPDDALAPQRAGFHMMVSDITGQTRLARMMEARALHDELTGLPNRMAWNQALRQLLNQSGHRSDAHAALMFLDMNDFKGINDRYGHHVGDAVLVHFARLLKTCLREKDFIARLGGDEFVVLLDILDDPRREATAAAERVLAVAAEGCLVNGQRLPLQPSIGIALQTGSCFDPTLLTQRADEAMYAAKRDPNRRVQIATL